MLIFLKVAPVQFVAAAPAVEAPAVQPQTVVVQQQAPPVQPVQPVPPYVPQQQQQQVVYQQQPQVVQQQPQPGPQVVQTQPQTVVVQAPVMQSNQWSRDLCGCFGDFGTCCYVLWCSCCAMTEVATYVGKDCAFCWGWFGCCCYALIRDSLRQKHSIPGSCCEDCLLCWFCAACMMCQMVSEVKFGQHKVTGC